MTHVTGDISIIGLRVMDKVSEYQRYDSEMYMQLEYPAQLEGSTRLIGHGNVHRKRRELCMKC